MIAASHTLWPVSLLCEVMQVRRRGLYADEQRQAHTALERVELALLARGKAMAAATRQRYGSRRLATHLQEEGCAVGRAQARRVLKAAGVSVRRPSMRRPRTTDSRPG